MIGSYCGGSSRKPWGRKLFLFLTIKPELFSSNFYGTIDKYVKK